MLCKECNKNEIATNQTEANRLGLCFTCWFWLEKCIWANVNDIKAVRIDGNHYYIEEEKPDWPNHCKGFGGSKFYILFNDGRFVKTTNLWHQGEIPDLFKDRLPNNAIFLYERTWN